MTLPAGLVVSEKSEELTSEAAPWGILREKPARLLTSHPKGSSRGGSRPAEGPVSDPPRQEAKAGLKALEVGPGFLLAPYELFGWGPLSGMGNDSVLGTRTIERCGLGRKAHNPTGLALLIAVVCFAIN